MSLTFLGEDRASVTLACASLSHAGKRHFGTTIFIRSNHVISSYAGPERRDPPSLHKVNCGASWLLSERPDGFELAEGFVVAGAVHRFFRLNQSVDRSLAQRRLACWSISTVFSAIWWRRRRSVGVRARLSRIAETSMP